MRISGEGIDWQVQTTHKKGKSAGEWYGRYFFPSLEHAVGKAYELALMADEKNVGLADVPAECARVKESLLKAVRKAVAR